MLKQVIAVVHATQRSEVQMIEHIELGARDKYRRFALAAEQDSSRS